MAVRPAKVTLSVKTLSENKPLSRIYTQTAEVPEARCLCEAVCRIYWVKNNCCRPEDAGLCLQTGPETNIRRKCSKLHHNLHTSTMHIKAMESVDEVCAPLYQVWQRCQRAEPEMTSPHRQQQEARCLGLEYRKWERSWTPLCCSSCEAPGILSRSTSTTRG